MGDKLKRGIIGVTIRRELDDSDLSWIGEYSNKPGPDDRTIDREARGDMGRHEFPYFIAANSAEDTGNPESVEQDYQRMKDYNNGGWCMVGVLATADVQFTPGGPIQRITSGGLWGIESDSGDYFAEVEKDQLDELKDALVAAGFTAKEVAAAIKQAKQVSF